MEELEGEKQRRDALQDENGRLRAQIIDFENRARRLSVEDSEDTPPLD